MPTYAILGGTGQTGGEIVELLAKQPDATLHVYARSRSKLLKAHPVLEKSDPPHQIYTGDLGDAGLIAECLDKVDVVFGTVGTNFNMPGCHIAQDLAKAIITALTTLRDRSSNPKTYKAPIVVFLTSAGMTEDKRVHANFPGALHRMLQPVAKYIYADFRVATGMFRRPSNIWIPTVFLCAPGIMPGPSQGDVRVAIDMPKKAPIYVTYADLARAIIVAGKEGERWQNREVGVVGAKMPPVDYGLMVSIFVTNLMATYIPSLWWFGHNRQWWG